MRLVRKAFLGPVGVVALLVGCVGCGLFGGNEESSGVSAIPEAVVPQPPVVLPNDVIAKVNGVPISTDDIQMRIQDLKLQMSVINPDMPWEPLNQEELRSILEQLIEAELMTQEAIAEGVHRSRDAKQRWAFLRRGFLSEAWIRWKQEKLVSNSEIERYYKESLQGFREPERIRLRQLVVATEPEARQVLARLYGEAGAEFAAMTREISIGPMAATGGMMGGWVMRTADRAAIFMSEEEALAAGVVHLDPILESAAFAIDREHGISNLVKGPDSRYHIFQLIKRQEGRQRSLTEVRDDIQQFLVQDKLRQAVNDLASAVQIERHAEQLKDVMQ